MIEQNPGAALAQELCSAAFDLHHLELHGRVVLYRADLNLPVLGGQIADLSRLQGTLPTLELLLSKGARVAVLSHLGRPNPSKQTWQEMQQQYSLQPVADALQQQLQYAFRGLAGDCVGPPAHAAVASLQPGQVRLRNCPPSAG
jgi:phosphoglycerate kinase